MDIDKKILEIALREMSLSLDALLAECSDEGGAAKAPSRQALMKAKAALPPYCSQAFSKDRRG